MVRYVMDTDSLRALRHYYPDRIPSFWKFFDPYVAKGEVVSVRESLRELQRQFRPEHWLRQWAQKHSERLFFPLESDESDFPSDILSVPHFQALVKQKSIKLGRPAADPFIIARARYIKKLGFDAAVITEEKRAQHAQERGIQAAKIPNVCDHFGIKSMNFRGFLEEQNWVL